MTNSSTSNRDGLPITYDGLQGFAWTSRNELEAFAAVVRPADRVLEIGTAAGVTAAALSDKTQARSIVCIDTFVDADNPVVADSDPARYVRWRANARPNMSLWHGDLRGFSDYCRPRIFDVILVDADHTLPGVLDDLLMAEPLLTDGGWVLAHDYRDRGWPDVTVAVDRFCHERRFTVDHIVGSLAFMKRSKE